MKRFLLPVLLILLADLPSGAQEEAEGSAFDAAWNAYLSAKQSGKTRELVVAAKDVLNIAKQSFGQDDERLPTLMSNYGMALLKARRKEAAIEVLEQSVETAEVIHGGESAKLIPLLANYADSQAEIRNSSAQVRQYKRALSLSEQHHGRDSVEYAALALRAGIKILELSKTQSGKSYLRYAREIYSAELGKDSHKAGLAAFYLGKSEMAARHFKTATNHFLTALQGFAAGDPDDKKYELVARAFLVKAYEQRGMSDEATEHCLAIGADSIMSPDQDYQPLFRMVPVYPKDMRSSRTEGYVDVQFIVDENGFVKNPVVIHRTNESFEQAALGAVQRFRYAPRFEDGKAVAVEGVKTRVGFRIRK